jgi:protein TonB
MTTLAMPAGSRPDPDAFRWGVSFAAVAAAHAAAVLWLLYAPASTDAGYVAGAAVAMIDLPETPSAQPNPASELPPGPQEAPSDAMPPPREETKPQQMAEVALPEPDPPKPEPPAEERQATAPPPVIAAVAAPATAGVETPQPPSAAVLRWQSGLSAEIKRLQQYSLNARTRGLQGSVRISFLIDRAGRVLESHILESSGSHDLDREVLSKVDRAHMPKPPPDVRDADLVINVGMNFSLGR